MKSAVTNRFAGIIGTLCLLIAAAIVAADPGGIVRDLRESAFDRMLSAWPRNGTTQSVAVVGIDRDALAAVGPWPWPRGDLARLVETITRAKPKVLAIDILLPGRETADSGDERLVKAVAALPAVLGLVLDPEPSAKPPFASPVVATEGVEVPDLMIMPGLQLPSLALADVADGLGISSLPAPDGEPVRAVPFIAAGAETLLPGLALEAVRIADGGATLLATVDPQVLRIDQRILPLPPDGLMRLHFSTAEKRQSRVVSAKALLDGTADAAQLLGKIVLLGVTAPEAGGLRLTTADPFMPSVYIQAEAIEQMLAGHFPHRASSMNWIELLIGAAMGVAGILSVMLLPPLRAVLASLVLVLAWAVAAFILTGKGLWLTDPLMPALIALFAFQGAGLSHFARTYRQRYEIERRFAEHLPPEVVRRIADNPQELRVAGETRIVTAVVTDIEGFTALTQRVGPEAIVSLLDRYVDLVAGIIIDHGGMVDKIVGDGMLGLFNAPLDLPGHPRKAVEAALAIAIATEGLRQTPAIAPLGLGRTRIGIETGEVILGEVGRGAKRDYTAHGNAINLASRLEGANKTFGSAIAIGPGTAAALGAEVPLRRLGNVTIRGIEDEVAVFTPAQSMV
jgi:adenylate cyclase